MTGAQSTEIALQVGSTRYADDHPAWREQVAVLCQRLRGLAADGEDPAVIPAMLRLPDASATVTDLTEVARTKGVLEVSALMLASAQVIRAAAVVIREWCKQDAGRSVSVTVVRADQSVEVRGAGADGTNTAYRALLAALDGGTGQRPDGGDKNEEHDKQAEQDKHDEVRW